MIQLHVMGKYFKFSTHIGLGDSGDIAFFPKSDSFPTGGMVFFSSTCMNIYHQCLLAL